MLELEKSKTGIYTLKYNGKYVHSKYDPINESEAFVKKVLSYEALKEIIVVYGLGLGYHIEKLSELSENKKIVVFEWNLEVVELCKKINKNIFLNKNILIIEKGETFYDKLQSYMDEVDDIVIYKPSIEMLKEENEELYFLLDWYEKNKESIERNKDLLDENYKSNLTENYMKIEEFFMKMREDKPYIVTAAGPSLDYDIEILKNHRMKFNIITVGTALRTLMNIGIRPDAIVIIDGNQWLEDQLRGFEQENIPLCFLNTASRWAVKSFKGPKYMFYNWNKGDNTVITTGKTVAIAALDMAIKCGAKEIIMLGQDLAFLNGKSHAVSYEETYNIKDEKESKAKITYLEGVNGDKVASTEGYVYFKMQIEKLIKNNEQVNFINCSKGAKIYGAKHLELKDYVLNYKNH